MLLFIYKYYENNGTLENPLINTPRPVSLRLAYWVEKTKSTVLFAPMLDENDSLSKRHFLRV